MAGFDENIVREYFELNGFFVRQLRKHTVQKGKKHVELQSDLVIYRPEAPDDLTLSGFQIFSSDIENIRGAVVGITPWNVSRFTPAIAKKSAKTCDFLKKDVIANIDQYFQSEATEGDDPVDSPYANYIKLLVIPAFPTSDTHRVECTDLLKAAGVDGVLVCSTILENLLRHVAVNHSYPKSDILQLLRVLKIYDMIREPQMTLFS